MKKLFLLVGVVAMASGLFAQNNNIQYDSALADSLGADAYGMKSYVFVILKTGEAEVNSKEKVADIFRGHLDNINRLSKEGKLVVAGPLGKNDKAYRGIYIFDVKTVEEAKELLKTDPAIESQLLDAEIFIWYGSAALPLYKSFHEKVEKQKP